MKRIFTLSVLILLGMICSCQKQDSATEQQLAQRKAELDAREKALDERMKALDDRVDALDEKVKALAEKGRPVTNVQTIPPGAQSQDVIADAAQMKAESDGARQQLPDDARALVADPLQGDPAKLEKDTRERLAQSQRELEEKQRSRQRKMELIQKWRMSGAAASTPAQATSSVPSPAVETTSPTPP